jgi:hypothetical protein
LLTTGASSSIAIPAKPEPSWDTRRIEDGTKRVSKAFTKEGLAYAMARINLRYKTLSKMLPATRATAWASLRRR